MRRLFGHRWMVGACALILTLAIGAGAWAVTGMPGGQADGDNSLGVVVDGAKARTVAWESTAVGQAGAGQGILNQMHEFGRQMLQSCPAPGELRGNLEQRQQQMQERRDAILDLVKEKMSEEDQAKLDQLLQTAEQQKETLKKAAEDLRTTMQQIRELVDRYLPAGRLPDGQVPADQTTGGTMF